MHVVHYVRHLREEEGGVVRSVLNLTQAFAEAGHRVTLLHGDASHQAGFSVDGPGELAVRCIRLPRPLVGRLDREQRESISGVLSDAEVLHLHTIWDPHNLTIASVASQVGIPYVLSTHGMLNAPALAIKPLKKKLYLNFFGKRLFGQAGTIHASAAGEKRQIQQQLPGAKVSVVPLVFDVDQYRQEVSAGQAEQQFPELRTIATKLLFLSRIHPIKGPEVAIEAVAKIAAKHDVCLIMAGPCEPDYLTDLKSQASELVIADQVKFVGMVSGDLKRSLYSACDLFVLPSRQENFGMVFPEALACGLPVVTSDTVDLAAELQDLGAVVVPRTADAFASAIDQLLSSSGQLQQRAAEGRAKVFEWLDTKRVVAEYEAMYRSVAGSKPQKA